MSDETISTRVTVTIPVTVEMNIAVFARDRHCLDDWESTVIFDTDYMSSIDDAIVEDPEMEERVLAALRAKVREMS